MTPSPSPGNATIRPDLNVTAGNETYSLSGSVVDASSGARLGQATLTIDGQPASVDAQGAFIASLTNGTHTLTVSAPGYGSASFNVTVDGADLMQTLRLNAAAATGGSNTPTPRTPGFGLGLAVVGLLIIALRRYGRD